MTTYNTLIDILDSVDEVELFYSLCEYMLDKYNDLPKDVFYNSISRIPNMPTKEMDYAAEKRYFNLLCWLHKYKKNAYTVQAMNNAACNGHLDIVIWLHENLTLEYTTDTMDLASKNGYLDIVIWLHENLTVGCTTDAMDLASRNGYLDTVIWLHENRSEGCTKSAMTNAALNGHLKIVKWLHFYRKEGYDICIFSNAVRSGNLVLIKWLDKYLAHHKYWRMDEVISRGHLEVAQWFHKKGIPSSHRGIDGAARNGHLDIIKWVHKHRKYDRCTARAMIYAVENNHFNVVKWLHDHHLGSDIILALKHSIKHADMDMIKYLYKHKDDPYITNVIDDGYCKSMEREVQHLTLMDCASRCGRLDVLKWLYKNNETFTGQAFDMAAQYGHLDVLKWLYDKKKDGYYMCLMSCAAYNGHLHIIQWLYHTLGEECIDIEYISLTVRSAANHGHLCILKWFYDRDIMLDMEQIMYHAVLCGHVNIVEWLCLELGYVSDMYHMDCAAGDGHLDVIKFLYKYNLGQCSEEGLYDAARYDHLSVVIFLNEMKCPGRWLNVMTIAYRHNALNVLEWVKVYKIKQKDDFS